MSDDCLDACRTAPSGQLENRDSEAIEKCLPYLEAIASCKIDRVGGNEKHFTPVNLYNHFARIHKNYFQCVMIDYVLFSND